MCVEGGLIIFNADQFMLYRHFHKYSNYHQHLELAINAINTYWSTPIAIYSSHEN